MGHGHEAPYTIPSYKEFKIDGIPQLQELEQALAKKGLKDPWIRNEAWRYNPGFGTRAARARVLFTRGMPLGIVLGAATAFLTKALQEDEHHDGGHGGHH